MLLDAPFGTWRQADGPSTYADVIRNEVRVIPERGRERKTYVEVPSEFYPLLVQTETVARVVSAGVVSFYAEEVGSRWIFGYFVGEDATDLWYYTKSTLPGWLK